MLGKVWPGEGSLVGEESVVHLPVFALLARAVRGLGCLERQRVDGFERKVPDDVLELAGRDVVPFELGVRLTDVPAAERSLVVGEVDQRQLGILISLEGCPIDAEDSLGTGPRRAGPCA